MTCIEHRYVPHPLLYSIIFCERCGDRKKLSAGKPESTGPRAATSRRRVAESDPLPLFDRDEALLEQARKNENEALEIARAIVNEGTIPGGHKLYHPEDEPEPRDDDDDIAPRDPDDHDYRRRQDESDALAPGARLG